MVNGVQEQVVLATMGLDTADPAVVKSNGCTGKSDAGDRGRGGLSLCLLCGASQVRAAFS